MIKIHNYQLYFCWYSVNQIRKEIRQMREEGGDQGTFLAQITHSKVTVLPEITPEHWVLQGGI